VEHATFPIIGPLLLKPRKIGDKRGFFSETYNYDALLRLIGNIQFVQDNHSLSDQAGTVRGLHFQIAPKAQGKLVRVVRGSIFDVAVDLRQNSSTYGQHVCAILSSENWHQLWLPVGFAHGFCTLEPNTEVLYKVDQFWSPADERGILWNDPALSIPWPEVAARAVIHPKDQLLPTLADSRDLF
jgi:dTDP-4-dehydrorhamnose 3,5-epimerase